MAHAPFNKTKNSDVDPLVGHFYEKEFNNFFEFSRNDDSYLAEYPHKVWVTTPIEGIDHGFRYAKVLKTVLYIVTDEGVNGEPIVEKWNIKGFRSYEN